MFTEWESGGAVRVDSATRRRVPGGSSIYGADPGDEVVCPHGYGTSVFDDAGLDLSKLGA